MEGICQLNGPRWHLSAQEAGLIKTQGVVQHSHSPIRTHHSSLEQMSRRPLCTSLRHVWASVCIMAWYMCSVSEPQSPASSPQRSADRHAQWLPSFLSLLRPGRMDVSTHKPEQRRSL